MKERGALLIHHHSHFPRFCRGVATVLFCAATGAFADDDWQRQQEENRRLDEQRYQQQVRENRARDDAEYTRQQQASREGFERQQAYAAKAEQFRYQSVERALLRPTTSSVPDELNLNGCKSSVLNVPTAQGTYTQETGFFAPKGEQPFFQATIGFGQSGELGWLRLKFEVRAKWSPGNATAYSRSFF